MELNRHSWGETWAFVSTIGSYVFFTAALTSGFFPVFSDGVAGFEKFRL